jgi:Outer membrane protein beta-barrel domain
MFGIENSAFGFSSGRSRRSRGVRVLISALGALTVLLVGSNGGRAEVLAGAELAAPISMSDRDRSSGPAVVGEASLRWWLPNTPVGVGLSIGERRDEFSLGDSSGRDRSDMRSLLVGGTVHYPLGPARANLQPYFGAGVGYARVTLDSSVDGRSSSDGFFVSPQVGLRVPFKHFEMNTALRYHHIRAGTALNVVGDRIQRNFAGLGFGVGFFARF